MEEAQPLVQDTIIHHGRTLTLQRINFPPDSYPQQMPTRTLFIRIKISGSIEIEISGRAVAMFLLKVAITLNPRRLDASLVFFNQIFSVFDRHGDQLLLVLMGTLISLGLVICECQFIVSHVYSFICCAELVVSLTLVIWLLNN